MNLTDHIFVKDTEAMLSDIVGEALSGSTIVAGLSGGADSTALVIALYALSEKLGFSLSACHINHMIRGEEADRDEEFSRRLCERYGIPFYSEKIDVPALSAERRTGLEETARDVRYELFERLCGDGYIATAHTASDNAETVLFNIIRGCGTNGLCGIPKRRGRIIRPILFAERRDVEAFLADIGETYVTDSTNLAQDCTRNIIRHSIIPRIAELNPSYAKSFTNLSAIALRDSTFLDKCASECFTDSIKELAMTDIALRSRIVSETYRKISGVSLPKQHTDLICNEIKRMHREKSGESRLFGLPRGYTARLECERLSVEKAESNEEAESTAEEYSVTARYGINSLCRERFLAVMEKIEENSAQAPQTLEYNQNIYSLFMEAYLFSDIINGIQLRSGESGDKIRISGMSKEVRKLFSARKVPLKDRKILPRICDSVSGEILALPYVGVCDKQHGHYDEADISIRLYHILNTKE